MKKDQFTAKRNIDEVDIAAWLQGVYICDALRSSYLLFNGLIDAKRAPKYHYPSRPKFLQEEKTEESLEREEKRQRTTSLIQEHNLMMRAKIQNIARKEKEAPPEI